MSSSTIPDLDFQYILAHSFPGFFLTLTLFMLLDVQSPYHLTATLGTLTGLITFAGFLLVLGTILGVIVDGIHHLAIEGAIFKKHYLVR